MAIEKKITNYKILTANFYSKKTDVVARELLGKLLIFKSPKGVLAGKIVETEAYFGNGEDPASHAHNGPTTRSAIMFGPAGIVYIYFNYGMHWLLNIVAKEKGGAGAVLIRAIEPVQGLDLMLKNRNTKISNLTNGPAKLTSAFGLNGSFNGVDAASSKSKINIAAIENDNFKVVTDTRIGIKKGEDKLLRFYIKDNQYLSR